MKKSWILFIFEEGNADGGINDMAGMFSSREEAEEFLDDVDLENGIAQLVDLENEETYEYRTDTDIMH
jgi:hypothetical protein